jgi:hypothetical protein
MNDVLAARRRLITLLSLGAAGVLAITRVPGASAAAVPLVPLSSADPTAQALSYSEDSSKVDAALNPMHKPDQKCSGCAQYLGKPGDARGGCNIYAGKSVSANGWCKAWVKKPGP